MNDQTLKAAARNHAKSAPKADPEIGEKAIEQARGVLKKGSKVQPVYKTQKEIGGENTHRDVDEPISEFDDPAGNKV